MFMAKKYEKWGIFRVFEVEKCEMLKTQSPFDGRDNWENA